MTRGRGKKTRRAGVKAHRYRPRQKKPPAPAPTFLRLPSPRLVPKCSATDRSFLPAVSPSQDYLMRSAKAVVSERLARLGNTTSSMSTSAPRSHTVTSLKRWSVLNKELPRVFTLRPRRKNSVDFIQLFLKSEQSMYTTSTTPVRPPHLFVSRVATLTIHRSSFPEPTSQPPVMERNDDRFPPGIRELHKWRVVARPDDPRSYRERN